MEAHVREVNRGSRSGGVNVYKCQTKDVVEAKVANILSILFSADDAPVQGLDNI